MTLWRSIRGFFMKENYDFDSPDITLRSFHPQLYFFLMLNGVFFENQNSILRYALPCLNTSIVLMATGFEIMFIYRGLSIEDYAFACESFCYIVILGTAPIVYVSIIMNKDILIKQVQAMNRDIVYICTLEAKYRESFLNVQRMIWQLCFMWFAFLTLIVTLFIGNAVVPLIYQSLIAPEVAYKQRPMIFPMWLPEDDPYRTPNYEIFMFLHIFLIFIIYQNFGAYVYMQFHILLHYYKLMDMIKLDFESIFDDLDESVMDLPSDAPERVQVRLTLNSRMKRIVDWHVSVYKCVGTISSVYGPPLVYQVMFSSVAICIMAYQVVDKLENGKIDFLFAILWFGAVIQLWIPCYLGTLIRDKAFSMGDACWNSGWHLNRLGIMLRDDIIIFILRTQQPLTIKFTALPNLTLETFSSIMSTSYSYFNMLRQSTKS